MEPLSHVTIANFDDFAKAWALWLENVFQLRACGVIRDEVYLTERSYRHRLAYVHLTGEVGIIEWMCVAFTS